MWNIFKLATHFGRVHVVTVGYFLVEFFDVGESGNDSCRAALRLLAVERQFRFVGHILIPTRIIRGGGLAAAAASRLEGGSGRGRGSWSWLRVDSARLAATSLLLVSPTKNGWHVDTPSLKLMRVWAHPKAPRILLPSTKSRQVTLMVGPLDAFFYRAIKLFAGTLNDAEWNQATLFTHTPFLRDTIKVTKSFDASPLPPQPPSHPF